VLADASRQIDATLIDASPDAMPDAACVPSGGESCDGVDNDCNGLKDDGLLDCGGGTCQTSNGITKCCPLNEINCDGTCVATSAFQTQNLLKNASFEDTPPGTMWVEARIDASIPLVTDASNGVAAHTPALRAWLGGFAQAAPNTDSLFQDVTIPASTTQLVFKGFYEVRTQETQQLAFDAATVELLSTTNTQLQLLVSLDNRSATTAWTQMMQPITASVAGQTVRLRFRSNSDAIQPTSFFFDTLELNATYCP